MFLAVVPKAYKIYCRCFLKILLIITDLKSSLLMAVWNSSQSERYMMILANGQFSFTHSLSLFSRAPSRQQSLTIISSAGDEDSNSSWTSSSGRKRSRHHHHGSGAGSGSGHGPLSPGSKSSHHHGHHPHHQASLEGTSESEEESAKEKEKRRKVRTYKGLAWKNTHTCCTV